MDLHYMTTFVLIGYRLDEIQPANLCGVCNLGTVKETEGKIFWSDRVGHVTEMLSNPSSSADPVW